MYEDQIARLEAGRFGFKHLEITIDSKEFDSFLPEYVRYMEEPVCEPAGVLLYYISRVAKQFVKVLISGEGGDEAFGGYHNYMYMFWLERIKKALGPFRGAVAQCADVIGHVSGSRVLNKYAPLMNVSIDEYYLSRNSSPYH